MLFEAQRLLVAWQGLSVAAFILALVEGHGLSRLLLTNDDCDNAFPFSGLMLLEAQRNKISRAGHEGLEKRGRFTASAAAHGWAKAPEVSHHGAPETSGDGFPVKR